MKTQKDLRGLLGIAPSIAVLMLICAPVHGQWVKVPADAIPRSPDGKPHLSAPAPRLPDGHPDLSGIWWMPNPGPAKTSNLVMFRSSLGPRPSWINAQTDRIPERTRPRTACPRVYRGSMRLPHHGSSFKQRDSWSSSTRPRIFGGRSSSMAVSWHRTTYPRGWVIQQVSGRATPSWSTPRVSTERPGWIRQASQPRMPCM